MRAGLVLLSLLLAAAGPRDGLAVLVTPSKNLALGRPIVASSTCGEANGQPIQELFCTIAGASPYNPHDPYSPSLVSHSRKAQEMRMEHSFLKVGYRIVSHLHLSFRTARTATTARPTPRWSTRRRTWWTAAPAGGCRPRCRAACSTTR